MFEMETMELLALSIRMQRTEQPLKFWSLILYIFFVIESFSLYLSDDMQRYCVIIDMLWLRQNLIAISIFFRFQTESFDSKVLTTAYAVCWKTSILTK